MSSLPELTRRPTGTAEVLLDSASLRRAICDSAHRECTHAFRNQLRALISTGSLARDEASFLRKGNSWAVCGDAEFMIVFEKNAALPAIATLGEIRRRIENDLLQQNIQCKIDLSAVHPSYFPRLPAHIFTYELKNCGQVIWGDDRILQLIPDWSIEGLSREDAWRLLSNRMIEQLAFIEDLSNTIAELTPRLHYATIKLYLDMATSYLVFARAYEPTYRGRAARLRIIAEEASPDGNAPFPLKDFSERVTKCLAWKLSGGGVSSDLRPEFWQEAITFARLLWGWEVIQMTRASCDLSTSVLCDRLARQLKFTQKFRGWASAARRGGGLKTWHHWPRWAWLGLRATPRYLVYRAGTELVFRLPSLVGIAERPPSLDPDWVKMGLLLPIAESGTVARRSDWQVLADKVLRNYREFITSTRT